MSTPTSIAGHPIHPMLVAIPIGLWVFSLIAYIMFVATGNPSWDSAAFLTLGVGLIVALVVSGALGGHLVHVLGVTQPGHR